MVNVIAVLKNMIDFEVCEWYESSRWARKVEGVYSSRTRRLFSAMMRRERHAEMAFSHVVYISNASSTSRLRITKISLTDLAHAGCMDS